MDTLYVERWPISFKKVSHQMKFNVYTVWAFIPETNQLKRLSQWVAFPWGGVWEDTPESIKPARMVEGKLHKIAPKHTHILEPVQTTKLLSKDQKESLDFLVKFPERGFHNHKKWLCKN